MVDALAGEEDAARGDAPGRIDEADDGGAGDRLAGAGLADHAQHLARADREGDVVDRDQRRPPRREFDAQMLDAEQRRRAHQRSRVLSASRSQSPTRLTATTTSTRPTPR